VAVVDSVSPAATAGLQPRKKFEVGVFDFPLPDRNDPTYGGLVAGPVAEVSQTGCSYGITKFSKHQDIAIRFLQFCSTPENNELFNRRCQWIPAVIGAKADGFLEAFVPNFNGYFGSLSLGHGRRTRTRDDQVFWLFVSGEVDFDRYSKILEESVPDNLARDYVMTVTSLREQVPDRHLRRSMYLARHLFADDPKVRADATGKLPAVWDAVMEAEVTDCQFKAQMGPLFADPPSNPISRDFMRVFDQIHHRSEGK
jgi:hypothetical protein